MARMLIEETDVYRRACILADSIYAVVKHWTRLDLETVGIQLVRAMDSVGSNLVEGDARSTDPDARKFFGYSRASGREARHWLRRASARGIMGNDEAELAIAELTEIVKMVHGLIEHRSKPVVREQVRQYAGSSEDPFA